MHNKIIKVVCIFGYFAVYKRLFLCYFIIPKTNKLHTNERRKSMKYECVIIWDDQTKTIETFETEQAAHDCELLFKMAFGNQVIFTCVNKLL